MTGGNGKKPPVADRLAALLARAASLEDDLRGLQSRVVLTRDADAAAMALAVAGASGCADSLRFLAERARAAGGKRDA